MYPVFTDMKSTNNQTCLLSADKQVYQIQAPTKGPGLICSPVKKLNHIQKLRSSFTHFLALQKIVTPAIGDWGVHEVVDFMIRIGFGESYSKVIIYNKIDGSKIKDFDEDLFTQTMGMQGDVELNKLRFHIGQCQQEHIESQTVFGWGSNGFG